MASPGRHGQGGLSLQTVVVASLASATAAIVTSRLFPPGATIFAAAMSPVIVAVVSDLLRRPARRVQELRTRRTEVMRQPARAGGSAGEGRWAPLDPTLGSPPAPPREGLPGEPAPTSANGAGMTRVHGKRHLHPKWIAATAAIAFVLAVAVLTIPELLFGGALGSDRRTTVFGGGSPPAEKDRPREDAPAPADDAPDDAPAADDAPEQPPAQTPPTEDPEASPQPTETAPAPTQTAPDQAPAQTPAAPTTP